MWLIISSRSGPPARRAARALPWLVAGGLLFSAIAGIRAASADDPLLAAFQNPGRDGKPFVYWWWKGNDATETEISRQLELLQRAGIAGVHIFPLGKPTGKLEWLSPDWWRLVRFAVDEAKKRGMQVDINAGYGWPSGGAFVRPEHRLQAISCAIDKLQGPAQFERKLEDFLPKNQEGQRSFAFVRLVPLQVDRLSQVVDLGAQGRGGTLRFAVPPGEHVLYAGIHRSSARPRKNTETAGDYALDYFDRAGVQHYLAHFADSFRAAVGGRLGEQFHAFFVSSVEIWPANWTTGFADEFQRRRGYDLMPYAHFVTGMYPILLYQAKNLRPALYTPSSPLADEIRRARYDYNKTLVELFQENFVETTQRWCREQGVLFLYQAYGFPWNIGIGENYLVPDIPEGNNWVLSDVADHGWEVWNKYAAAGGHLTGKRLISNEAMTTTKGKFRETLDLVKRADDFIFITGNTRSVVHGFCYSPADAAPPGWHQYGTFLSEHNPWWPYFPRWTAYNARLSQLLHWAAPVVDVALLCPTADVWSDAGLNRVAQQTTPRYGYKLWESLAQQGISADYLHEAVLQKASFAGGLLSYGPMNYRQLILCDVATLEPATAEAIRRYVEAGGRLVIVGQPPARSPGLADAAVNDRKVQAAIAAAMQAGAGRVTRLAAPDKSSNLLAWAGTLLDRTQTPRRVVFASPSRQLFQVHYQAAGRDIFFLCNQDAGQRVASLADVRAGPRAP
ncbi:MAG: glycosyl hydrolase, partial [Acidimicrobiia bacterium]